VYLLDKAKVNPNDTAEKGARYRVVAKGEDMALPTHINHQIALTGMTTNKSADQQTGTEEERGLLTLEAKTLVLIADRCTAASK
jgi:hypothetical protein